MAAPLIGIADHDPVLIRLLDQVLTEAGFETVQLPEGARAYEEIKKHQPDLIVLDTAGKPRGRLDIVPGPAPGPRNETYPGLGL